MAESKPLIKHGWLRALIYFVAVFFIIVLLQLTGIFLLKLSGINAKENEVIYVLLLYTWLSAGVCLFTYVVRKFIDRKSFKSLGFEWKGFSTEAALGLFIAIALLGIGSLILVALGFVTFLSITLNALPLLLEFLFFIVAAFLEEVVFRGYILNNLMQSMNKRVALGISAILFALFHAINPGVTLLALANIFVAGILLGLNYVYTKNLWFGILFHISWNFLQGPILGYEVSGLQIQSIFHQSLTGPVLWTGGPFGFEGSLLCPLILIVCILVLMYGFTKKYVSVKST